MERLSCIIFDNHSVSENVVPLQLVQLAHLRQPDPHCRVHDPLRLDLVAARKVWSQKVLGKNHNVHMMLNAKLGIYFKGVKK
jgi:hypothetical protein